ncbi:unnamed protein product [Heligmosomoides polygyrus]|uniref:Uncharacterized protein n=1 Tax=Heligmosomoides polygyrus TaxID=6339 RepID=A0A183G2M9_HELPZ|nr:unnamed protein product [Heligmosomoides polygyrus]
MSDYERSDSDSDYSDGPVQIPIDYYQQHANLEPEDNNRQQDLPPPSPSPPPSSSPQPRYNPWLEPNLAEEMDLFLQLLHNEWMLHLEHNRRDLKIENRWYLAALMTGMTPPPTPSDSEHSSSESEGAFSDEED